jgi:hypothetical protein
MQKFLKKLFEWFIFFIGLTSFLIALVIYLERSWINFKIQDEKKIVVIGNSHTECAINDEILPEVFNFSKSGSSFFYSYLKLRALLRQNQNIESVVVGYSFQDLDKSKDEWFSGAETIKFYMPRYLFLLESSEFLALASANPVEVITHLPRVIIWGTFDAVKFRFFSKSLKQFGGFLSLDRDKLDVAKEIFSEKKDHLSGQYSNIEEEYLKKIYELVTEKKINFVLLNTPMHKMLREINDREKDHYISFAKKFLPNAKFIDHSNLDMEDSCFGDLEHLNANGARIYSDFLKNNEVFLNSNLSSFDSNFH